MKNNLFLVFNSKMLGGTELRWLKIIDSFISKKYELKVILLRDNKLLIDRISNLKVECIILSNTGFIKKVKTILAISKNCKNCIFITNGFLSSLLIRFCKLMKHNMVSVTSIVGMPAKGLKKFKWPIIDFFTWYLNNYYFFNSKNICNFYLRFMPFSRNKMKIIYNGISIEEKYLNKTKSVSDDFIIVNVANLLPIKNQIFLLECMKNIFDPKVKLIILGEGAVRNQLESKIAIDKISNVKLMGFSNDIYKYLFESKIFITSSFCEGFSNAIMEAMAAKLPVIAYDGGGVSELVEDGKTGFLLKQFNVCDWVAKINFLRNNNDKVIEFGNNGYNKLKDNFSFDTMLNSLDKFFCEIN